MPNKCKVNGCTRPVNSHGLCRPHYERFKKYGDPLGGFQHKRLGERYPSEYRSYYAMKGRCLNKNNEDYRLYGGRGIKICDEWLGPDGFEHFLRDMGTKPYSDCSLDRIDVNGDYCKENCRWATPREQALNRRRKAKIRGVRIYKGWEKTTYTAHICYKNKRMHASFATLEDAIAQRKAWERELRYEE